MSFSQKIKQEIIENKQYRQRYKLEQASGLFLFASACSGERMAISTELPELAELYVWFAKSLLGEAVAVRETRRQKRGRMIYSVELTDERQRAELFGRFGSGALPDSPLGGQGAGAFLSGTYLACGSMIDPAKSYHLEFVAREAGLGFALAELLASRIPPGAGITPRRGGVVIYIKEYGQIEDLLAMIGASRAALSVIDVEMFKQVRNHANRVTNCETANIDKQVDAAAKQLSDIEAVLREVGEEGLSEPLLAAARLRREHPEASLRELCELSPEPVSRSGLFHRYASLAKMAERIKAIDS